ncbi:pilus assembly protein N-terminal domain-containing protein [Phenylobacterium sp.]|uniref:pilus assembly protein N-terminal domain-containing protein n=1 Tax=Phenylobacterium sp. TaxID=1871053 RepID=UPI002736F961|nr:pilus assembly protein N-terminal domain-containing protein [Phenylobacterium sp.]MDP3855656.1 pilus assembly protein N-terminal domain-containing protein [Phenylobacterium sp.]
MRRLLISLTAGLALLATASQADAPTLAVPINQSARLLLPAGARDVMIGNPSIADVNVIDGRSVVVLGKGYGVTNLLVIDALGRTVLERQVVVSGPGSGRVSVIRGGQVDSYACAGSCEKEPPPEDKAKSAAPPPP